MWASSEQWGGDSNEGYDIPEGRVLVITRGLEEGKHTVEPEKEWAERKASRVPPAREGETALPLRWDRAGSIEKSVRTELQRREGREHVPAGSHHFLSGGWGAGFVECEGTEVCHLPHNSPQPVSPGVCFKDWKGSRGEQGSSECNDAYYRQQGGGWLAALFLQNYFLIHSCGLYKELIPRPGLWPGSWEVTAALCSVFKDQA